MFEVYCGKQELPQDGVLSDYNSGPAAVMRNLREVFGPEEPGAGEMRLIVTDCFYTSVSLAMQMLTLGFYSIGTVQIDHLGLPVSLVGQKKEGENKKTKPQKNRPGTFEVAGNLKVPGLRALRRWDSKAVYMLASGGSVEMDRVVWLNKQTGQQAEVACPRVLKDYQTLMGGVDAHDQLRLQRYALLSWTYMLSLLLIMYVHVTSDTRCNLPSNTRYTYKSLFLGLVDLAVINAYIVFNARRAGTGQKKINHIKFLKQLHLELYQLRDEDCEGLRYIAIDRVEMTPSKSSSHSQCPEHKRVQNDEWQPGNNQTGRKRRT
ncbi:Hypothetical protein PHPALM_8959 [Phytophthora palmivora]|uniref:PiggyBac transposable element-derived protein domain-containing protein n=1 Tax=Phytophthora palmivora TaxID=4796 RepID=A0A2P4Y8J2_9STRA|nr:Hypothetical protein PHPALM_8959 [Phytophthora palmivora]